MPDSSSPSPSAEKASIGTGEFTAPSVKDIQALLPQYEILEKIGAGGMGAVYKARQPNLDRIVAIKILPTGMDDQFAFKERFRREARAMARLQHPGIIAVFEFGETESQDDEPLLYIVMEYVEGADLNHLIKTANLDLSQTLTVVTQICEALQYAHEQNIVHRDIKPANIMLNMSGSVKIADFGLAKIMSTDTTVEPSLTGTNIVMGTVDYLAPEQMDAGAIVDQRADLYALGVLIYEMLTGNAPRGAFVLPSKQLEGLDPRVDYLVVHAMATKPDDRFQSANELSTAILNICTSDPESKAAPEPEPTPESEPESKPSSQVTTGVPWESTTAKPAPIPAELKPATQADLEAAIQAATLEATRIATQAAQESADQMESSIFLSDVYSDAKSLIKIGAIFIGVLLLGALAWSFRDKIASTFKPAESASTPQLTKEETQKQTDSTTPSAQWPKKPTIPTSTNTKSTPQPTQATAPKLLPPPHPRPGFPPPGGKRPPPRKR